LSKSIGANYLRLELSVANVVANSYKKFGQIDGRLAVGTLQALANAELD
jgi:hypothetical protein